MNVIKGHQTSTFLCTFYKTSLMIITHYKTTAIVIILIISSSATVAATAATRKIEQPVVETVECF